MYLKWAGLGGSGAASLSGSAKIGFDVLYYEARMDDGSAPPNDGTIEWLFSYKTIYPDCDVPQPSYIYGSTGAAIALFYQYVGLPWDPFYATRPGYAPGVRPGTLYIAARKDGVMLNNTLVIRFYRKAVGPNSGEDSFFGNDKNDDWAEWGTEVDGGQFWTKYVLTNEVVT